MMIKLEDLFKDGHGQGNIPPDDDLLHSFQAVDGSSHPKKGWRSAREATIDQASFKIAWKRSHPARPRSTK